ncbi:MAG: DUF488 domain-containing protein [Betaproteobacteria bacterium]|nr:DUF488 domain-containing protein [Betaproteobacteria bacterium]
MLNPDTRGTVLTIGHSTRSLEEFVGLLQAHAVTCVVDVRSVPRSRHNPQFNGDALSPALQGAGIAYAHAPGLGGFRRPVARSSNEGWRNLSFRGYADYMQTTAFADNLEDLIDRSGRDRVALMCAEAVPWRCHRSLIADALVARGIVVEEIVSRTRLDRHVMTSFAAVDGTAITYPANVSVEARP